jgi:hypothetical protein
MNQKDFGYKIPFATENVSRINSVDCSFLRYKAQTSHNLIFPRFIYISLIFKFWKFVKLILCFPFFRFRVLYYQYTTTCSSSNEINSSHFNSHYNSSHIGYTLLHDHSSRCSIPRTCTKVRTSSWLSICWNCCWLYYVNDDLFFTKFTKFNF